MFLLLFMTTHKTKFMCTLLLPLPTASSLLQKCQSFQMLPQVPMYFVPAAASVRGTGAGLVHSSGSLPCYLLNAPFGPEAPASPLRFDDFRIRVEPLRKALVLAALSGGAHLRVTLVLQHSVQALGVQAAGVLVGWLAVAAGDL